MRSAIGSASVHSSDRVRLLTNPIRGAMEARRRAGGGGGGRGGGGGGADARHPFFAEGFGGAAGRVGGDGERMFSGRPTNGAPLPGDTGGEGARGDFWGGPGAERGIGE